MRLYRPMMALAGLDIIKVICPDSLGPWAALQPLAPTSERLNTALVRWDSEGAGPARKMRQLVYILKGYFSINLTLRLQRFHAKEHTVGGRSVRNAQRKFASLSIIVSWQNRKEKHYPEGPGHPEELGIWDSREL